jgi:hypothetical protein
VSSSGLPHRLFRRFSPTSVVSPLHKEFSCTTFKQPNPSSNPFSDKQSIKMKQRIIEGPHLKNKIENRKKKRE